MLQIRLKVIVYMIWVRNLNIPNFKHAQFWKNKNLNAGDHSTFFFIIRLPVGPFSSCCRWDISTTGNMSPAVVKHMLQAKRERKNKIKRERNLFGCRSFPENETPIFNLNNYPSVCHELAWIGFPLTKRWNCCWPLKKYICLWKKN